MGNKGKDKKVTLKIAETNPKFVGRGVALLDPKVMDPILYTRNNIGLGILQTSFNYNRPNFCIESIRKGNKMAFVCRQSHSLVTLNLQWHFNSCYI